LPSLPAAFSHPLLDRELKFRREMNQEKYIYKKNTISLALKMKITLLKSLIKNGIPKINMFAN